MAEFQQYILEVKSNGSAIAYYQLVRLFEQRVFTMCYRIIGNREEAEEASQDVFLKCFKKLHMLEDPDKFPHWLLKIAYSKAIDYARKKKIKNVNLEDINEIANPKSDDHSKESLDTSEIFEKAIHKLDEEEKALINLYYQEDMSIKEISQITDLTESNVKIKLYRSRNKLKQELNSGSEPIKSKT